ncbi:DsbA family protein [Devosia sp.]|uniref:DsbA family protein n=1 Tax=Devosia sp. TaxID=1871048 RepID=UPI0025BE7E97|nr:DsbA family protein [Devosia sp.]
MMVGLLLLMVATFGMSAASLLVSLGYLGTAAPRADFESLAKEYLLSNPEVIVEAVKQLEARQQAAQENELTAVLTARHDEIVSDPTSPVGGNVDGDVTVVEFFDYNCPYCRQAAPMLQQLQQEDSGLRIVFKEFPILGPGSHFAARAALASQKQGKYLAFHSAMMAFKGSISESSTLEIAASIGLDVEQLKLDMADPAIEDAIAANFDLADALRLSGTPSFISGKQITRGLVDLETMAQLIAAARAE